MSARESTNAANAIALKRIRACAPILKEVVLASDVIGFEGRSLGHAGPPLDPGQVPAPTLLHALMGAVQHEGWASNPIDAKRLILEGEIRLHANHSLGVVSPMAGVVRPSQRLFRVVDEASGACSFATLAEKGQRVLRFGAYGTDVAQGLRFVETTIADAIAQALPPDGLPMLPLLERAVELGDDVHQRNIAGMLSFLSALAPSLPMDVRDWLISHPQHFLNYAMAAAKLCLDAAVGVSGSSIVTAISRNGSDCGIQIAGLPGRWFKAPAVLPRGAWFPGFSEVDAHADLGDSAIMEAFGLGGCIAHTSPEIARAMDRSWEEATACGNAMQRLFAGHHSWRAPALSGAPALGLGLDAYAVLERATGVRIHTGVAHRNGISGWIGIGVAEAPVACFASAVNALGEVTSERERP
ncbi:DUF1116 domain-containing protein [Pandoraea anhela]|uniref:DUF1116 domain-containing protein n=1 Tax=Pandoraea anhela TaxID=2508295 RepID=A0A5E4YR86_9BURK|nr:DUF1116 domain-containing protein [Pandoraea anhela]VVE51291.1 hypothetical protein PAN31108_04716 [Pandoraea anhela]